ncbi:hypothetical protein [Streptomyces sp. BE133]|uniref:hypothetical protein n=1 Tax=Streptomyces sp. BE133 TaxID=3002523 RepID=UPI002E75B9E3|nr:hypothetical protein [Streptomyces sp. BE133]MEE1812679.1 hypothetical protein [Streptomyces sp. BE133]
MTPTPQFWRPDEEEAMTVYPIAVAGFAALTVCAGLALWRLRALQRLIRLERATVRLTEAAHHRDVRALVAEHRAAELREQLLTEAEQIITAEYARTTRRNPQEGDTP